MHYEIRYKHSDRRVNDANAIRDSIEYLGVDKWKQTFAQLIQPGCLMLHTPYSQKKQAIRSIRFMCMIAGIQGYPAAAIIRTVWACHR